MTAAEAAPLSSARRLRRVLAIGVLVAVPVTALALAAVNLLQGADLDAVADRQQATVAQLERRAKAAQERGGRRDTAALFLAGSSPALARAELQRNLVDAVERTGGRVIETQDDADEPAPEQASDQRVKIRIAFDARSGELLDLVHGIEAGLPLLVVERIEVRRLDAGADGDPDDPMLRIGLTVSGAGRFPAG